MILLLPHHYDAEEKLRRARMSSTKNTWRCRFLAFFVAFGYVLYYLLHPGSGLKSGEFIYGGRVYQEGALRRIYTNVTCPTPKQPILHPNPPRKTVLASYPRSGNTMIRTLLERSTGYLSTGGGGCPEETVKGELGDFFGGECSTSLYLRKTHLPSGEYNIDEEKLATFWSEFDQGIHLKRNPFDSIWSWYALRHTLKHTARIEGLHLLGQGPNPKEEAEDVMWHLDDWMEINDYWHLAPLPVHHARYEDFKTDRKLPLLAAMVEFLAKDELPTIKDVACADQVGEWAYIHKDRPVFYAWDHFEPKLRRKMLDKVKRQWCEYGYETLFEEIKGFAAVDCAK